MAETRGCAGPPPEAALALAGLLDDLARVVASLPPETFAARPVGEFDASVGAHVRHCLDHVQALVSALPVGRLDYDDRRRDTPVERRPDAALAAIARLRASVLALPPDAVDRPVLVRDRVAAEAGPVGARSSFGRELMFVLSHTTHHGAIIAAMVRRLGHEPPRLFGYAPSTVAFLSEPACAP